MFAFVYSDLASIARQRDNLAGLYTGVGVGSPKRRRRGEVGTAPLARAAGRARLSTPDPPGRGGRRVIETGRHPRGGKAGRQPGRDLDGVHDPGTLSWRGLAWIPGPRECDGSGPGDDTRLPAGTAQRRRAAYRHSAQARRGRVRAGPAASLQVGPVVRGRDLGPGPALGTRAGPARVLQAGPTRSVRVGPGPLR